MGLGWGGGGGIGAEAGWKVVYSWPGPSWEEWAVPFHQSWDMFPVQTTETLVTMTLKRCTAFKCSLYVFSSDLSIWETMKEMIEFNSRLRFNWGQKRATPKLSLKAAFFSVLLFAE